jgi:hypothetical protein
MDSGQYKGVLCRAKVGLMIFANIVNLSNQNSIFGERSVSNEYKRRKKAARKRLLGTVFTQ